MNAAQIISKYIWENVVELAKRGAMRNAMCGDCKIWPGQTPFPKISFTVCFQLGWANKRDPCEGFRRRRGSSSHSVGHTFCCSSVDPPS